jgi:quercetin dioxygenase-like cupin family protein
VPPAHRAVVVACDPGTGAGAPEEVDDMTEPWSPRTERPQAGPHVSLRLADEIERLQREPGWRDGDRNAITLTRGVGLRLVLTALRQGAALQEHRAPAAATVHVLSGRLALRAAGEPLELGPGDVVVMEAGLAHAAEALADSVFLLTLAEGERG